MAWIEIIDEKHAKGDLKDAYDHVEGKRGKISNIMRIHSLNPEAMKDHLDLYISVMFSNSGLSRADRELLAIIVSRVNGCDYCVNHHSEALYHHWKDRGRVDLAKKDFRSLDLSERIFRMLEYGEKLTKDPKLVGKEDVERLRDVGFSDRNILNINLIVSYFNFVNRISSGLGVDYTSEEMTGYRY